MRKFLFLTATILVGFFCISCKENKETYYTPREITVSADVPKTKLPLERMDLECFGVHDIVAVDSMIVIFTSNKQSLIQVFDYSGQPIAKLSPSGRAGNEFLQVYYTNQNAVINEDRYLYVGDDTDLYLYNLSGSIRNGANLKPQTLMKIPDERYRANGFNILFRNDGSYFQYMGTTYNNIIIPVSDVTFNPDGSINLGDYKLPEFEYYPPQYTLVKPDSSITKYDIYPKLPDFKIVHWAQRLYFSIVRMSDDQKKVVVADAYQDRMTFINLETDDMFGLRCPDFVDYAEMENSVSPSKIVEGVMQVVTCGSYIFVLYDHNTVFEEEMEDKPVNTTIRVFTWDGQYIAELIPDFPITNFFIDSITERLIAVDYNEQFYTADLSTIIKSLSKAK